MASFGYFTLGLALAWPASALPSIRFVFFCKHGISSSYPSLAFGEFVKLS